MSPRDSSGDGKGFTLGSLGNSDTAAPDSHDAKDKNRLAQKKFRERQKVQWSNLDMLGSSTLNAFALRAFDNDIFRVLERMSWRTCRVVNVLRGSRL